jgi:hypothetical protein
MAVKIGCVGTLEMPDSYEVLELGNDTTQAEDLTFLQAVQSGDASAIRCDYSEAVKTLQLTLAATQSAIEGSTISL